MSFGDGDLHVIVAQLKTENARLKQRNGELKSLVCDMWRDCTTCDYPCSNDKGWCVIMQRVSELMEVGE